MTKPLSKDETSLLSQRLSPALKRKFEKALARELGLIFDDNDIVWCDAKYVLITGGIRSGKSLRAAFKAFCKALDPSTRLIWLVGPDYIQAREEFRYILEWCLKLDLVARKPNGELEATTPIEGSRTLRLITNCLIETKSAQHTERLASVAPDMIVLCEPGQMSSEVYETALGRLTQKRGDLWMAGTLESDATKAHWQWYEDLARKWFGNMPGHKQRAFRLPTWANHVEYPRGEAEEVLQHAKAELPEYIWNRRFAGIPSG